MPSAVLFFSYSGEVTEVGLTQPGEPVDESAEHAAYRATSYWVETQRVAIRMRVGERNELLDFVLEENMATRWAFITAHNPGSIRQTGAANVGRQRELRQRVARLGLTTLDGRGIGDRGDWAPEESILILGLSDEAARGIGAAFGQVAVLYGESGDTPRLVFCTPGS
jgi:hypothetical protein